MLIMELNWLSSVGHDNKKTRFPNQRCRCIPPPPSRYTRKAIIGQLQRLDAVPSTKMPTLSTRIPSYLFRMFHPRFRCRTGWQTMSRRSSRNPRRSCMQRNGTIYNTKNLYIYTYILFCFTWFVVDLNVTSYPSEAVARISTTLS